MKKRSLLTILGLCGFATIAFGVDFLTVDVNEVYSKYDKAIESQEKFNEAARKAQQEMNEMMQEGIKMGDEFQELEAKAKNPALTDAARQKFNKQAQEKAKDIEKKQIEINQYQQQTAQTLAQRRQSVINLHMNEIKTVTERIAKKRGVDLVLNDTVVLYAKSGSDISDEVITELNSNHKREGRKN